MRDHLDGLTLQGTYGFELTLSGSLDKLKDVDLDPKATLRDFDVIAWPKGANIAGLNTGIRRLKLHDPKAKSPHYVQIPPSIYPIEPLKRRQAERMGLARRGEFSPSLDFVDLVSRHPNWVPFEELSEWMIQMITSTEDGGFFFHSGFSFQQMVDAIADGLTTDKPMRGASTISMQLIKNAFLGRERTLSRKLQEVMLTWFMESVARIPKRRILEVYFNIIEFGPELYGLGNAASHYFGKRPMDLSLREAAFLTLVIPSPRDRHEHWVKGAVSRSMSRKVNRYIQGMYRRKCDPDRIRRMERRGRHLPFARRCPDPLELEMMLEEPIEFYKPDPTGPALRPDLYTPDGRLRQPKIGNTPFGWDPEDEMENHHDNLLDDF